MGNAVQIEGVWFVGLILLGYALGAPFFSPGPAMSSDHAAWLTFNEKAKNTIQQIFEITDAEYGTKGQRVLTQCLNGEWDEPLDYFRRILHPDALYKLTLISSTGTLVVCQDAEPSGQVSGGQTGFLPKGDTAFMVSESAVYDGDEMGMDLTVIPMRNGYVVQRVVPVEVEATTDDGVKYRAAAAVRIAPEHNQVAMALVHEGETTNYYWDKEDETFILRLSETSGNTLPAGTRLAIHLPYHWTDVEPSDDTSNWRDKTAVRGNDGWAITAVLNTTLQSATLDFQFDGKRPESSDATTAFDLAYATLDDGATGKAHLVFRGWGSTQTQAGPFTRGVSLAIPPLLKSSGSGAWSLVFANPSKNLLDDVRLTSITLKQPHGLGLFQGVTGDGWAKVDNATLRWSGATVVPREDAREFRFTVATNDVRQGMGFSGEMRVRFPDTGHVANLTGLAKGSAHQVRLYPNATLPGYAIDDGLPGVGGTMQVCSDIVLDNRPLRGCAEYRVSDLASLQGVSDKVARGAAGSSVSVENAMTLRPGDWLRVHADFSSLDAALADDPLFVGGRDTNITVYHPWTGKAGYVENWTVFKKWSSNEARLDGVVELPRGVVHGSYVVVAERSLDLVGGGLVDQVVRKVTWVNVGPRTGGIGEITVQPGQFVYDVGLLVALPEWV